MTDMFGKRVTEEDFKGRYTLVGWPNLGEGGGRGWGVGGGVGLQIGNWMGGLEKECEGEG